MYGKHFESTYTGSMVGSGFPVFAVWGYIIANTKADSMVEVHPRHLARIMAGPNDDLEVAEEEIAAALDYLCGPDPDSRSPEAGGRRLIPEGSHQYRVVNHSKYRTICKEDERREYNREKQREYRRRDQLKGKKAEGTEALKKKGMKKEGRGDED